MSAGVPFQKVYYPESDGKPMGETDWHRNAIIRLIELLQRHYRGQQIYVSGDLLVYYEQGNPKKFLVPDVFVVKGLCQTERRVYKTWVERKVPDAVIEVTSRKTRKKDESSKPEIYARLGVPEYFLFDPEFDYLDPPLQGRRLLKGIYRPIPGDPVKGLVSKELGLRLLIDQGTLQLEDVASGRRLLTAAEELSHVQAECQKLRADQAKRKSSNH